MTPPSQRKTIRFQADVEVLASVRDFALAAAQDMHAAVDLDVLAVVVGELAANAAVHQDHQAELTVELLDDGAVRVSVRDPDPGRPRMGDGQPWDVDGHRGLQLVEALAADWGVTDIDQGKEVWAQLAPEDRASGDRRSGRR